MSARVRDYTVRPCSGNSALLLPASSALYLTRILVSLLFFFFNDPAPPEISPLPLPDALRFCLASPASAQRGQHPAFDPSAAALGGVHRFVRTTPPPLARRRGCRPTDRPAAQPRSEEHTSELQSPCNLVCRLLLEKKKHESLCSDSGGLKSSRGWALLTGLGGVRPFLAG